MPPKRGGAGDAGVRRRHVPASPGGAAPKEPAAAAPAYSTIKGGGGGGGDGPRARPGPPRTQPHGWAGWAGDVVARIPPFQRWRIGFYGVMALCWLELRHGPMVSPFERALAYSHMEWVPDLLAVTTETGVAATRLGGVGLALLATRYDWPAAPFAALWFRHVFVATTNFVNHNYLFFLLSTLMALYVRAGSDAGRRAWINAARWQVATVYFFAMLWKVHPDWLDGTIARGIFLSFEEQGVARGVPWSAWERSTPHLFSLIALAGLGLDAALFFILTFAPPGSPLHWVAVVFHGFTGFTMAQRIGYEFPLTMIAAVWLFQPVALEDGEGDDVAIGERLARSARRLWAAGGSVPPGVEKPAEAHKKAGAEGGASRQRSLAALWIAVQLLLPLRMPVVSNMDFRQTGEAYRFSWTMMLHSKHSLVMPGVPLFAFKLRCNDKPFPAITQSNAMMDPRGLPKPLEDMLGPAGSAVADLFPRQLAPIAGTVANIMSATCKSHQLQVHATVFSSINSGPFVRLVDPTVDLHAAHRAMRALPYPLKVYKAFVAKPAAPEHEFLLRRAASLYTRGYPGISVDRWIAVVDRAACLWADPMRFFSVPLEVRVVRSAVRLQVRACKDITERFCLPTQVLEAGKEAGSYSFPPLRVIELSIAKEGMASETGRHLAAPGSCARADEDILIEFRYTNPNMDVMSRAA